MTHQKYHQLQIWIAIIHTVFVSNASFFANFLTKKTYSNDCGTENTSNFYDFRSKRSFFSQVVWFARRHLHMKGWQYARHSSVCFIKIQAFAMDNHLFMVNLPPCLDNWAPTSLRFRYGDSLKRYQYFRYSKVVELTKSSNYFHPNSKNFICSIFSIKYFKNELKKE